MEKALNIFNLLLCTLLFLPSCYGNAASDQAPSIDSEVTPPKNPPKENVSTKYVVSYRKDVLGDIEQKGLSDAQFEFALRDISTAPYYVLVSVINDVSGEEYDICLDAYTFLGGLYDEHKVDGEDSIRYALRQNNRTFKISKAAALKTLERPYNDAILSEARMLLRYLTIDEIRTEINDFGSRYYQFYYRKCSSVKGFNMLLAHVLSERGILCYRDCGNSQIRIAAIDENRMKKSNESKRKYVEERKAESKGKE